MSEITGGRSYREHPANFIELTGPCKEHVRFSSNGEVRTMERAQWDLLPEWKVNGPPVARITSFRSVGAAGELKS